VLLGVDAGVAQVSAMKIPVAAAVFEKVSILRRATATLDQARPALDKRGTSSQSWWPGYFSPGGMNRKCGSRPLSKNNRGI
jgi:hypothetical protein